MALSFPSNPNVGDIHTEGDRTWRWSGVVWIIETEPTKPMISPSEISGLVFHVDGTSLGSNGSSITAWTDLVAGNNPAEADSGRRPTVTTSYFGGSKAALFDGSNDRLVTPLSVTTVTDNFMVAAVFQCLSSSVQRCPIFNGAGASNGWGIAGPGLNNSVGILAGGIAWSSSSLLVGATSGPLVVIARRSGGAWSVRCNGLSNMLRLTTPPTVDTPNGIVDLAGMGYTTYWNGALASAAIWDEAVTDADAIGLENYWMNRYGITSL